MPRPLFIDLPKDQWIKVADAVTGGLISIVNINPDLVVYTYRDAGDVIDIPDGQEEGIPLSRKSITIKNDTPIDVYLYAVAKNGKVRVDI